MRKTFSSKLVVGAATMGLTAAALVAVGGPAFATGTAATFIVSGGSLSISVPASASLGTVAAGVLTESGALGVVTVTDNRGLLNNAWTATVTTTSFVTGTSTTSETVPVTSIAYTSGASTATTGLGTFVPTVSSPLTIGSSGVTGANWTGLAGVDSATWDPTVTFTLLGSQVAGTYTGTVTHSVA